MTSPQIEYRTIPSFDGYLATSDGHVIGRWNRPLAEWTDKDGYRHATAALARGKDAQRVRKGVHVFVCLAFHGPKPTQKHEVRHLDGTRTNNVPENLAWSTRKENSDDRILHGTVPNGTRSNRAKLTEENIPAIRDLAKSGTPRKQIALKFGVSSDTIGLILHNRTWKHVKENYEQTAS